MVTATKTTGTAAKKDFLMSTYSGLLSSYIILCWKPAIQYTIYESIQRLRIQRRQRAAQAECQNTPNKPSNHYGGQSRRMSWMESFLIAILARTIATVNMYPYIRQRLLQLQQQDNIAQGAPPTAEIKITNTECTDSMEEDILATPTQQQHVQPFDLQNNGLLIRLRKCIMRLLHQLPKMLSSQSIRKFMLRHVDVASYYGIGPELIRGVISSVLTFLVQEYVLRLAITIQ